MKSYSQLGQDEWVLEMLDRKKKGVFIEVGASNGVYLSNTLLLEKDFGWEGLCIEPSSEFENLQKNRNCQVANELVFKENGLEVEFIEGRLNDNNKSFSGIKSTLDKHHVEGTSYKRKTITLNSLLNKISFSQKIDFLSVDTGGSEYEILQGIDFEKYHFSLITIEHNWIEPKRTQIRKFLFEKGYHLDVLSDSQFDDWFIHSSLLINPLNTYFNKANTFRKRGQVEARLVPEKEKNLEQMEEIQKINQLQNDELFKREQVIMELTLANQGLLKQKEDIINSVSWKVVSKLTIIPYFLMVRLKSIVRFFSSKRPPQKAEQEIIVSEINQHNMLEGKIPLKTKTTQNSQLFTLPHIKVQQSNIVYKKGLAALAIPCILKEKEDIIRNFYLWDNEELAPYGETVREEDKIPIVIIVNYKPVPQFEEDIKKAFYATKKISKQFQSIDFHYCNLTGDNDTYESNYSKKVGEKGYKSGPNNQFFMAMEVLSHYGDYVFFMETDCYPIKPNWLAVLSKKVVSMNPFWIMGSVYRGLSDIDEKFKTHLNGNAIYAVGNLEFQHFLFKQLYPFLAKTIKEELPWLAFDCVTDYYFYKANPLKDRLKWKYLQSVYHFFLATDYIQNHAGFIEFNQKGGVKLLDILENSPNTYILHGRHLKHEIVTNLLGNAANFDSQS